MEDKKQEDLDMMSLIRSFKNGIRDFFAGIGWLIEFSIANWIKLIVFMIVAAVISLALYYMGRPYYKSSMAVTHIRLNNEYCAALVNNLNNHIIQTHNNAALAEILKIDQKYAREVKSIKYSTLNENVSRRYQDSLAVTIPFLVEVEIYDNAVLDTLQKGIMSYLESNRYAERRKQIDALAFARTEEKLTEEIAEIDSLKKVVKNAIIPRSNGNGIILGEPVDPVNVYKRGTELFDKRMNVMRRKILNNSFEVLVDFSRSEKKASAGRLTHIAAGFLAGYIVGLIVLLARRRRKKIISA